MQSAVLAQQAN